MAAPPLGRRGWTFVELLAVIGLAAVVVLIGSLSIYRGKAMSEELACQDDMRAIHSALQIYWAKNGRTYPADQAAFEEFLRSPVYFPDGELHCPQDGDRTYHYQYHRVSSTNPVPGDITITCPTPGSGHGTL